MLETDAACGNQCSENIFDKRQCFNKSNQKSKINNEAKYNEFVMGTGKQWVFEMKQLKFLVLANYSGKRHQQFL